MPWLLLSDPPFELASDEDGTECRKRNHCHCNASFHVLPKHVPSGIDASCYTYSRNPDTAYDGYHHIQAKKYTQSYFLPIFDFDFGKNPNRNNDNCASISSGIDQDMKAYLLIISHKMSRPIAIAPNHVALSKSFPRSHSTNSYIVNE